MNGLYYLRVSILEKSFSVWDEFRHLSAQNNVCSFGYSTSVTAHKYT